MALGEKIAIWRKRRKLTQEELAIKANVTKAAISNYENGHSAPSNDTLVAIANTLIVSTDYLLGRTEDPNPTDATSTASSSSENGPYMAYFGGPPKELDEEEAAYLEQELEMFRAFREKRLREKEQQKDK